MRVIQFINRNTSRHTDIDGYVSAKKLRLVFIEYYVINNILIEQAMGLLSISNASQFDKKEVNILEYIEELRQIQCHNREIDIVKFLITEIIARSKTEYPYSFVWVTIKDASSARKRISAAWSVYSSSDPYNRSIYLTSDGWLVQKGSIPRLYIPEFEVISLSYVASISEIRTNRLIASLPVMRKCLAVRAKYGFGCQVDKNWLDEKMAEQVVHV